MNQKDPKVCSERIEIAYRVAGKLLIRPSMESLPEEETLLEDPSVKIVDVMIMNIRSVAGCNLGQQSEAHRDDKKNYSNFADCGTKAKSNRSSQLGPRLV